MPQAQSNRKDREDLRSREGPSIREFLRYYVLVLLQECDMSAGEIRNAISRKSTDNRRYRPSGQLLVGTRDVGLVLGQLARGGLIERLGRRWRLTATGSAKLSSYEQQKDSESEGKEKAARKLLDLLGQGAPGETVLDVGTGEGFLAFRVAELGYSVVGIDSGGFDYSKDSIQQAREKAEERGGGVEFRQADVGDLSGMTGDFDYVVSSQAVHCMEDQQGCLRGIHRLLKADGVFLCMDFAVGLEGFFHHGWHGFLAISREEWSELLPRCGFAEPVFHQTGDYLVLRAGKTPSRGKQ